MKLSKWHSRGDDQIKHSRRSRIIEVPAGWVRQNGLKTDIIIRSNQLFNRGIGRAD
jgi:hypothetical protein